MTKHPFLSDEWIAESKKIHDEYSSHIPAVPMAVRMNLVVNEVPFGDGVIPVHIDTGSEQLEVDSGHLDNPDLTVTLSWATAKAMLVDGDVQAAMNAFLGGRIRVDGDITKMLALQSAGASTSASPQAVEMVKRIQEMTA